MLWAERVQLNRFYRVRKPVKSSFVGFPQAECFSKQKEFGALSG